MPSRTKIDSVILSCNQRKYLLPMNTLVEVISMERKPSFLSDLNDVNIKIHKMIWNELEIPLLSMDLNAFTIKRGSFEKIIVLRAMLPENWKYPPFFGLYMKGEIQRKVLFPKMITWIDENQKIAKIIDQDMTLEVTIFDLFALSEKIYSMTK